MIVEFVKIVEVVEVMLVITGIAVKVIVIDFFSILNFGNYFLSDISCMFGNFIK